MASRIEVLIASGAELGHWGANAVRIVPMARCNSPHSRSEVEPRPVSFRLGERHAAGRRSAGKKS